MSVKVSEVRSGIFVVLAVIVLGILVFSVGNFRAQFRPTVTYVAYLDDAKFLKAHDPVTYGGLRVGEIDRVEVTGDRFGTVKVTIEVPPEIEVRQDSILILKQDGMLGAKYIEISPGTPGSARAAAGSELKGKVPPAITDLTARVEGPLAKLDVLLDNINLILGKPENQQNIAAMLDEARKLLAGLNEQVRKVGDLTAKTAEKTQEVLEEVQGTIKSARAPLTNTLKNTEELTGKMAKDLDALSGKILKSVDDLSAKLSKTADSLDTLLRDADALLVQNNKNIYETIRALRDTGHHLELAAKRIRANPAMLLFGGDETPEELKRADETEIRLKGRARRYDKEDPK